MLWRLSPASLRALLSGLEAERSGAALERLLERCGCALPPGLRGEIRQLPERGEAGRLRAAMTRAGIRFLRRTDPDFPERLRVISDPPPFLFFRGEPMLPLERPRVGVIGARAASAAGREIAYTLARDLSLAGCVVVSGLARGIDGEAHRGALEAGGRTVAVLGTGADLCYPAEHAPLFRQMLERGGVVTEFPPGAPARPLHFPRRNRILAALCDVLVLVEGSERSGARSTVDFALEQGREVLAVPRDILHPGSALPNRLLRDGAAPALSAAEVLHHLPPSVTSAVGAGAARDPAALPDAANGPGGSSVIVPGSPAAGATAAGAALDDHILSLLSGRPQGLDACLRAMPGAAPGAVSAALSRLEVIGRIRRLPGGRFQAPA